MSEVATGAAKELNAHVWERSDNDWYVEPEWCARRLFEEETFEGDICDPCCGGGTIPKAAIAFGFDPMIVVGQDIVDRGYGLEPPRNFFTETARSCNIVCNPPFNIAPEFARHALSLTSRKVALIFPTARLNAAHWLRGLPLKTVWLLTPRPSMPPGHVLASGQKPGGGKMDFCWIVFEHGYQGIPQIRWLHRDGDAA